MIFSFPSPAPSLSARHWDYLECDRDHPERALVSHCRKRGAACIPKTDLHHPIQTQHRRTEVMSGASLCTCIIIKSRVSVTCDRLILSARGNCVLLTATQAQGLKNTCKRGWSGDFAPPATTSGYTGISLASTFCPLEAPRPCPPRVRCCVKRSVDVIDGGRIRAPQSMGLLVSCGVFGSRPPQRVQCASGCTPDVYLCGNPLCRTSIQCIFEVAALPSVLEKHPPLYFMRRYCCFLQLGAVRGESSECRLKLHACQSPRLRIRSWFASPS